MNVNYELIGIFITVIIQGLYVAYKMGKFEEKLIEIEKKQDKHNQVIERTYKLESRADVQDTEINVANQRIKDLEVGYEHIRERSNFN